MGTRIDLTAAVKSTSPEVLPKLLSGRVLRNGVFHPRALTRVGTPGYDDDDSRTMSAPARILVVDDDRAFLDVLADTLRDGGHAVDATTDAAEALRRAEAGTHDVALLDLIMPGTGGLELGDRIK